MATTRFPNGVTTADNGAPLGEFILPDMTKSHVFFDDFDTFNNVVGNWNVAPVGAPVFTLPGGDGGRLLITNSAADDDSAFVRTPSNSFLLSAGKRAWFDSSFQVSDATQSDVVVGMQVIGGAPLSPTDGVFFIKVDGSTSFDFVVEKDSVATTTASVATLANATDIRLSFFYNGIDRIRIYVNGLQVGSSVTTNIPDDQTITIVFGIVNGEAVAKTMNIDYILAAKER